MSSSPGLFTLLRHEVLKAYLPYLLRPPPTWFSLRPMALFVSTQLEKYQTTLVASAIKERSQTQHESQMAWSDTSGPMPVWGHCNGTWQYCQHRQVGRNFQPQLYILCLGQHGTDDLEPTSSRHTLLKTTLWNFPESYSVCTTPDVNSPFQ